MKRGRAILALVVLGVTLACTGGGDTDGGGVDELDPGAEPNSGEVELAPGFVPDPYEIRILSGGGINVGELDLGSECTGWAISQPDLSLELSDDSDGIRIIYVGDYEEDDATLIVYDANGDWVCNDDYDGWDPMVEIAPADGGRYDIWVGSYEEDVNVEGMLYITELAMEPSDLY